MKSGKALASAALIAALIGCSDNEKDAPIVVDTDAGTQADAPPPRKLVELDLRADTNRDGVIDVDNPADDDGEDTWNASQGAVFLANLDDDDGSCPKAGNDDWLAQCFDGNDERLDGESDLLDLAEVLVRATGEFDDAATATVQLTAGANRVRLWVNTPEGWVVTPEVTATAAELREGLRFRVEGKDVVRDASWDGKIRLEATLNGVEVDPETTDLIANDAVEMRVAPVVLRHHLDPVRQIYSSELGIGGDGAFTTSLQRATATAQIPGGHVELDVEDQWTQDYFETAYMAMPTANGLHVIDVFIRSANIEQDWFGRSGLREAGRVVYTVFHGPDHAGITAVGGQHSLEWDTLNSFGNTETIPPFSKDGQEWTVGRIIRGQAGSIRGNEGMLSFLTAQGVQEPLFVDTGWLLVAHIDETISFVKTNTPLGWAMLANDAAMAVSMFDDLRRSGASEAQVFRGKAWLSANNRPYSAATTVGEILQDADVMSASADAVVEVDDQVAIIKEATGISDEDILPIPFTHWHYDGGSIAHQPGIVNGIVPNDRHFLAPNPYGPQTAAGDVFEAKVEEVLGAVGYDVLWVEDWDMYHRLAGEIHCATNVVRNVDASNGLWWETKP